MKNKEIGFMVGLIYFGILFGTGLASLSPYSLESWLLLSACLMGFWLILILVLNDLGLTK